MLTKTDPSIIVTYLEDSSNLKGGHAEGVYIAESQKEIPEILKECSSKGRPLTTAGGLTGTTGGCIPFGGWILSTEKLNKIINIDKKNMTATIECGVPLSELQKIAEKNNLLYPPDPTENTCFLGGNVATNASGSRSFRFGSTRDWTKRLKVILSNGEILDIKRGQPADASRVGSTELATSPHYALPNVKTAAGYYSKPNMDLIDLFIGSEGTLGVVTEIEVSLIPNFCDTLDVIAFFSSEEKAVDFVFDAKKHKDVITLEYFDKNSLELLRPDYKKIPADAGSAIYFEIEITPETENAYLDKWAKLLETHRANLETSWLGMNTKQKQELKDFRHSMPEHINEEFKKHNTIKFASDIAVPDDKFKEMLAFYNTHLALARQSSPQARNSQLFFVKFGHIGQSHLHVNLVPRKQEYSNLAKDTIMQFVKKAISLGGTCSAEHGIGKIKYPYLHEMFGDSGIAEMVRIKKLFDPACILNQGNIFSRNLL